MAAMAALGVAIATPRSLAFAAPPDAVDAAAGEAGSPEDDPRARPAPTADSEEAPLVPRPSDDQVAARLFDRSAKVAAWLNGDLPPEIEPGSLFELNLADFPLSADELGALQDALSGAEQPDVPTAATSRARALEALRGALSAVARLPAGERARRFDYQLRRHDSWRAVDARASRLAQEASLDERRARRIELLLAGELPTDEHPRELLWVPLEPRASGEAAPAKQPGVEDPRLRSLVEAREAARVRLAKARAELVALDADARTALLEVHERRVRAERADLLAAQEAPPEDIATEQAISDAEQDAQAARKARDEALAAAKRSKSERARAIAEERARLLGIKEAQSLFRAELTRRQRQLTEHEERALEWTRRVAELADRRERRQAEPSEADALYEPLREALTGTRDELRETLRLIGSRTSGAPDAPGPAPAGLDRSATPDLEELATELEQGTDELRRLERESLWNVAGQLRDNMVMLNSSRLRLLELASRDLRRRMTGLGPDGVRQVRRELDQIGLEIRFQTLHLPTELGALVDDVRTSPIPLIFALIQLGLAVVAFRWWRGRGAEIMRSLHTPSTEDRKSPPSPVRMRLAAALWYLDQIRTPLEYLGLLWLVLWVLDRIEHIPDLQVVWLIGLWFLLGSTAVLWVDAIARRDSAGTHKTSAEAAALRVRSLRVVSLIVVFAGLVSSLANAIVGRGAIYTWVLQLVWVVVLPLIIMLIAWWRPHIFRRINEEGGDGTFFVWVRSHQDDWTSFPAAVAAGAYLLGRGLVRFAMRRAAALEWTRRLLAYLFRREVARRAEAEVDDTRYEPISPEEYGALQDTTADDWLVESFAADELEDCLSLLRTPQTTLSAIVGERGAGKSTLLRRLDGKLEPDRRMLLVKCPSGGFGELRGAIARQLGLSSDASDESLIEALAAKDHPEYASTVVAVDNAHRLVKPAIGGLRELDAFTDFARRVGPRVSWIVVIGAATWQYVSRARGGRVFFDQVLVMPAATEEQIGEMLRRRTRVAGLEPSYARLSVPRQFGDEELDENERVTRAYDRILWDYSDGNPEVALYFWRESLFRTESGELVVRLFKERNPAAVDGSRPTLLFVLRAILQLDFAGVEAISECTQLPASDVADALRFAAARGFVEEHNGIFRITLPWYRSITRLLARQHLLSLR